MVTLLTLAAPFVARGLWPLGWGGVAAFLALALTTGGIAWRWDVHCNPADPEREESRWRRGDRLGGALLLACLGLVLTGSTVLASWERSTPHSTPVRRVDHVPSSDAERVALRRLDAYAPGELPELGDSAVFYSQREWSWFDVRPWWSALGALGALLGASYLVQCGRRFGSRRARLRSFFGVPALCALPVLYAGLWYELPAFGPGLHSKSEVAGTAWLPGFADDAVDALVEVARARGYEVLERRAVALRDRARLEPLARRVQVRMRPSSLFERWELGDDGPRRTRPELHLDALCDVLEPGTSLSWSAGLLELGAPEEAAWREQVGEWVREASDALGED